MGEKSCDIKKFAFNKEGNKLRKQIFSLVFHIVIIKAYKTIKASYFLLKLKKK